MSTELTAERVRELFGYDGVAGTLLKKFKSGELKPCGHKPTLRERCGQVMIEGKKYLTHRVIWLWHYGSWPEGDIDHLDRDPMNNRIDNLREVSKSENQHNQGLRGNNASGYPGVSFVKSRNKFLAQICVNGKNSNLGRFTSPEEAFLAYQLAKIELHPTSPIAQEYLRELTLAG